MPAWGKNDLRVALPASQMTPFSEVRTSDDLSMQEASSSIQLSAPSCCTHQHLFTIHCCKPFYYWTLAGRSPACIPSLNVRTGHHKQEPKLQNILASSSGYDTLESPGKHTFAVVDANPLFGSVEDCAAGHAQYFGNSLLRARSLQLAC